MAGAILLSTWGAATSAAAKDDVRPADSSAALVSYTEIAVGTRPESVARGFKNKLFVTTQGADNTATAADGGVKMIDGTTVTTFATGLYEPKGIAYTGKYLIVADLARVWRIDASGNKVAIVDNDAAIPKPFYNDVTLAPHGDAVLVVEMGSRGVIRNPATSPPALWPLGSPEAAAIPVTARVFRVTIDGGIKSVIGPTPDILIANGVTTALCGSSTYATDFFNGRIVRVNPKGKTRIVAEDEGYRGADGIALDKRHRMYVSSFESGQVFQVSPSGKKSRLLVDFARNGAADLMYDVRSNSILLASTTRGSLVTIPLG
jgi:sugar lactone lactonase YvrE